MSGVEIMRSPANFTSPIFLPKKFINVFVNGSMGFNVFSFSFSGFDFYINLEAD
jgi:hypothetical protein